MSPELIPILSPYVWPTAALLLAGLAAFCIWLILDALWQVAARPRPGARSEHLAGAAGGAAAERIGARVVASALFGPGPGQQLTYWCRQVNLERDPDNQVNPAQVMGQTVLYGVPIAFLALPLQSWWMLVLGTCAALVPILRVREAASGSVRRLRRSLPELLALTAGETEVGTPLETALANAVTWGVPAAPLISAALGEEAAGETPLFSRLKTGGGSDPGTLLQGAGKLGNRDWRGVVLTFDAVSQQGIGGSTAMQDLAGHLATKTKQELMESSEKLEDRLLLPLVICFFPVLLAVSVVPMAVPLLDTFRF